MPAKDQVEKKLRALRDLLRQGEGGEPVAFHAVPEELAAEGARQLVLTAAEKKGLEELEDLLVADPRFEHLARRGRPQLIDFAARVLLEPGTDQVARFIEANARTPQERICHFPVELLRLGEATEVAGVSLIPGGEGGTEDLEIAVAPEVGTVAAVPVLGTNQELMVERARAQAEHALRILRISLREDRMVHAYQLRFRLGDHYAFESGVGGWKGAPDAGWELELDPAHLRLASQAPFWEAPLRPQSRLERRVDRAMRWIEQAFLVGDPLLELLFCFFCLEALLGDRSDGLKGQSLAFRRALLGSVTKGRFANPNRLAFLYEEVRSAAVHGSEPPSIDAKMLVAFASDTRLALVEYVEYAQEKGMGQASEVFAALEADPKRALLIKGLREKEPDDWAEFLDGLEKG